MASPHSSHFCLPAFPRADELREHQPWIGGSLSDQSVGKVGHVLHGSKKDRDCDLDAADVESRMGAQRPNGGTGDKEVKKIPGLGVFGTGRAQAPVKSSFGELWFALLAGDSFEENTTTGFLCFCGRSGLRHLSQPRG